MKDYVGCIRCCNFSFHPNYPHIAVCLVKQQVISLTKEVCKSFLEKNWDKLREVFSERGFLYCAECMKPIYSLEELEKHRLEFMHYEFAPDDVAYEDSPTAD
ncbi:MAG: hypothetical protein QXK95_02360 [Nitrososphaerota archaeon]|nr:hypothetical protein [Candidatus Geocrenenecus dongiae]